MDENGVRQVPHDGENDSFLDGWEETGQEEMNPGQEETDPGGDGGKQAGEQEEGQSAGDGIYQETGGAPSAGGGGNGGEGLPPAGGSGGNGGEGLPPAGGSGQGDGQPEGGQQPHPPPAKTWTLDYMGQAVTVSEADVPALAQKALDYDRVCSAYEEARPVMDLFRGFAQQTGVSVQEYVARLRTQAKQAQGMDERSARHAVEMEDREARVSMHEAQERARQEAARRSQESQMRRQSRIQTDVQEFISVFPNAARDFNSIPKEVWDAVNGGMSLVAAYARYNSAQAQANAQAAEEEQRRQEAVRRQNAQNAAASTGSMQSAGSGHGPKDPFLEGWDE